MKIKLIYALILLISFSCKKDKTETYRDELTQKVQNMVGQDLKPGFTLKSINLLKIDTLSEWKEADFLLMYSNNVVMHLSQRKEQLLKELDNVKTERDLESIKAKNVKVNDSMKQQVAIGESVRYLSPKDYKTGNYQAVFLLKIADEKSKIVQNDSLFIYTNDKKEIFTQAQFIDQCVKKFNKN